MKFRVGDRIVVSRQLQDSPLFDIRPGDIGTVIAVAPDDSYPQYAVEFDRCVGGHRCGTTWAPGCPDGHGAFLLAGDMELLPEEDTALDDSINSMI